MTDHELEALYRQVVDAGDAHGHSWRESVEAYCFAHPELAEVLREYVAREYGE